ncbi:hypothetical protein D0962_23135 [Leptolyngbyaceae cyanobacterium CCMR0082]|uniref:Uncharacterized protein n=1 Tax=Adonisia turfae CCMR0082 TaxID=2304604 RepID=A0A6M0SAT9_9CYAN|nr:hypothetical protein [Adonisia turfae]NEZ65615.1 hypothetical protein [Adonisia turfae CCMR0082]
MATFFATFKPGSENYNGYMEVHAPSNNQAWQAVKDLDINAIHSWQTFQNIIDRYSEIVDSLWVPYEVGDEIKFTGQPGYCFNPRHEQTGTIIEVLDGGIKYEVNFSDNDDPDTAIVAVDEISLVHEPLFLDKGWAEEQLEKLRLSINYWASEATKSQREGDAENALTRSAKAIELSRRQVVWHLAQYRWPKQEIVLKVPGENGDSIVNLVIRQLKQDGLLAQNFPEISKRS